MTGNLQVGEIVDILIRNASVARIHASRPNVPFIYYPGALHQVPIAPASNVTITRVASADWPPQAGDIWHDRDGDPWYGHLVDDDDTAEETYVLLRPCRSSKHPGESADLGDILNWHGPFTLGYREGQDTPPAEAGPPLAAWRELVGTQVKVTYNDGHSHIGRLISVYDAWLTVSAASGVRTPSVYAVKSVDPWPEQTPKAGVALADIQYGVTYVDQNGWVWRRTGTYPSGRPLMQELDGFMMPADTLIDARGPLTVSTVPVDFSKGRRG